MASVLLLFFIIKKDISDLKAITFFLFLGILAFIVLLGYHMIFENTWNPDADFKHSGYFTPNEHKNQFRLFYAATTILVGLAFQTVFFPVLGNLQNNTKQRIMKTSFITLMIASSVYVAVIFISIYTFGHEIHSDILTNVGLNTGWETYVLGVLFAIVGSLHIPLIFFVGKEAMLIMIFTFFYTVNDKEYQHLDDGTQMDMTVKTFNKSHNNVSYLNEHTNVPTRSELNHTNNVSVLRKTHMIPNIDIALTQQALALDGSVIGGNKIKEYQDELNKQEEDGLREPSHKDLPAILYHGVGLIVYAANVLIASVLDDVSLVYGIVGALAISMLFFILPGIFYIRAYSIAEGGGNKVRLFLAWVYFILGFGVMG